MQGAGEDGPWSVEQRVMEPGVRPDVRPPWAELALGVWELAGLGGGRGCRRLPRPRRRPTQGGRALDGPWHVCPALLEGRHPPARRPPAATPPSRAPAVPSPARAFAEQSGRVPRKRQLTRERRDGNLLPGRGRDRGRDRHGPAGRWATRPPGPGRPRLQRCATRRGPPAASELLRAAPTRSGTSPGDLGRSAQRPMPQFPPGLPHASPNDSWWFQSINRTRPAQVLAWTEVAVVTNIEQSQRGARPPPGCRELWANVGL